MLGWHLLIWFLRLPGCESCKKYFPAKFVVLFEFLVKVCSFQHLPRVCFLLALCLVFVFFRGATQDVFPSILEFESGFKWKRNDHNPIGSTDTKDIL
jgi:hypothetical protein